MVIPFGGYQIRPENALQRAQELLEVGKQLDALETLHEVIKSRKLTRSGWTKSHELIMLKHLELCVELRKPHLAKDGLFQYRNMVQQINVKSLENVILYLLTQAEGRAEAARQQSMDLVEEEVDDLDQADSPESLLLASVSRTDAQDRADRTVLSPWLRFLWDSYRQCLELLRNNAQVEQLYHKVARQAFDFCLKYSRRAEFRKLCDNLRGHLHQLQKSQHLSYSVKLNNIETLMMQQDTRLKQLDIAIQMELWQEAFKSAEDVHNLMSFSKERIAKTMVKGQALANYYEKLALVFWKAGDKLHHAAALFRLFQHTKDMKKTFSDAENSHHATRVLLATLSIGPGAGLPEDLCTYLDMEETMVENQRRLAQLLELSAPPTRRSLLRELARSNVLQAAALPAQNLHGLVENLASPLRLANKINLELKNVENLEKEDYSRYIESLRWVAALRILHQISEVYETISMERLSSIIPFYDNSTLQQLLVHAAKRGYVRMRIDHRADCVNFPHEVKLSQKDEDSQLRVVDEALPGESIKACLRNLYGALDSITTELTAEKKRKQIEGILDHGKMVYKFHHKDNYVKILERKRIIESFKENCERKRETRLREEQQTAHQIAETQRISEQKRLMAEEKEFHIQKEKTNKQEMMKKIFQDKWEKLTKSEIGRQVIKAFDESEIESLSTEALFQKQIQQYDKIKKEQAVKLKNQEKKWDHLVRALHEKEVPQRENAYIKWKDEDYEFWIKHEEDRVAKAISDHDEAVKTYDRLGRVGDDAQQFLTKVIDSRAETLASRTEAWKLKLASVKAQRLKELRDRKKEDKRHEWKMQKKQEAEMKHREWERAEREKEADRHAKQGMEGRRERGRPDDDESRGDADVDWRRGAPPVQPQTNAERRPAPPSGRADEGSGPWSRGAAQEQPAGRPMANRAEQMPSSMADEQSDWRGAGAKSQPQQMQRQQHEEEDNWRGRQAAPAQGAYAPPRGGTAERVMERAPAAPEGAWRGQNVPQPVMQRREEPPQDQRPWRRSDPAKPAAYVPPSTRNRPEYESKGGDTNYSQQSYTGENAAPIENSGGETVEDGFQTVQTGRKKTDAYKPPQREQQYPPRQSAVSHSSENRMFDMQQGGYQNRGGYDRGMENERGNWSKAPGSAMQPPQRGETQEKWARGGQQQQREEGSSSWRGQTQNQQTQPRGGGSNAGNWR